MVSQSKNGKLYVFQNMVSIKWFLNQKMENYMFFKIWFPLNGFSIKKWKTICFQNMVFSIIKWFPLNGFSIKKWKTIYFQFYG